MTASIYKSQNPKLKLNLSYISSLILICITQITKLQTCDKNI